PWPELSALRILCVFCVQAMRGGETVAWRRGTRTLSTMERWRWYSSVANVRPLEWALNTIMRRILPRIASLIIARDHLGNPLQIAWKRLFAKPDDLMTVVDRATSVRCKCSLASHHMFGDTWYARVYDVPGVPIRSGDVVLDIGANQGFFTCYAA